MTATSRYVPGALSEIRDRGRRVGADAIKLSAAALDESAVVVGLAAALAGVWMIYPPLAIIIAGLLVALFGVGRMRA